MLQKVFFRHKFGVLQKYFYSNVIVFLIPFVLLGYVTFYISVDRMNEEIKSNYEEKFHQVVRDMDKQLASMTSAALEISSNKTFRSYTLNQFPVNEMEAIQQLKRYNSSLFLAQNMLFYTKGEDAIYSMEGKYDPSIFFSYEIAVPDWKNFLHFIDQTDIPFFTSDSVLPYRNIGTANSLIYVYPISTLNTLRRDSAIIYFVTEQAVRARVENLLGTFEGNFYIYNTSGELVFSVITEPGIGQADISSLLDREDINSLSIHRNKQPYHAFKSVSTEGDFTYILTTPSSSLLREAENLRFWMMIVLCISLLFGLLAAWYFAYLNYSPIKKLKNFIKKEFPAPQYSNDRNEWTTIDMALHDTVNNYAALKAKADEQVLFIRQNLLHSLLKGHWDSTVEAGLCEHSLKLEGPYYVVMVIMNPELSDNEQMASVNRLLKRQDLFGEEAAGIYAVELIDEKYLAVICNLESDSETNVREIAGELLRICEEADIPVQIGIGKPYSSLKEIGISYIEAVSAIESGQMNHAIASFQNITEQYSDHVWYPSDQLLRLLQAVKQGEHEMSEEMLVNLKLEVRVQKLSVIMEKLVCFETLNALLKTLHKLNLPVSHSDLNMWSNSTNMDELIDSIGPIIQAACDKVCQSRQVKREQIAHDILGYIDAHFKEYDISLDSLAKEFNLSSYALTKYLRDETGLGFKDYIIKLRMDEAKTLLYESNKSVSDITAEVGYSNPSHFIKMFKKLEGITPAEFRQLQKN
ncbi:helix-turn-helix domain-containing protein [Paenibacillus sp. GCM10027626]|uniref:helix-turn-helix domain-containing protein n=1 Tax=Paenibacillus sp. GCM10027626 TaxID=3273411 RepID=UPI00363A629D